MLSVQPIKGPDGHLQLHASTVVIDGKAVAFTGPSGAGKSGAALACMNRGAHLLADDITWLHSHENSLIATCPPPLSGRIEARGVGILNTAPSGPTPLHLVVDLGTPETQRLPALKSVTLLGQKVTLLHTPDSAHFLDAILLYIKGSRED